MVLLSERPRNFLCSKRSRPLQSPTHAVMKRIPWALPTKVKQPELDGDHSLAFSVEFKAR